MKTERRRVKSNDTGRMPTHLSALDAPAVKLKLGVLLNPDAGHALQRSAIDWAGDSANAWKHIK